MRPWWSSSNRHQMDSGLVWSRNSGATVQHWFCFPPSHTKTVGYVCRQHPSSDFASDASRKIKENCYRFSVYVLLDLVVIIMIIGEIILYISISISHTQYRRVFWGKKCIVENHKMHRKSFLPVQYNSIKNKTSVYNCFFPAKPPTHSSRHSFATQV